MATNLPSPCGFTQYLFTLSRRVCFASLIFCSGGRIFQFVVVGGCFVLFFFWFGKTCFLYTREVNLGSVGNGNQTIEKWRPKTDRVPKRELAPLSVYKI